MEFLNRMQKLAQWVRSQNLRSLSKNVGKCAPFVGSVLVCAFVTPKPVATASTETAEEGDSSPGASFSSGIRSDRFLEQPGVCAPASGRVVSLRNPTRFSREHAYLMQQLARVGDIMSNGEAVSQLHDFGFPHVEILAAPKSRFHAVVGWNETSAVVAFRGTRTWQQGFSNGAFLPRAAKTAALPGLMHRGFLDEYEAGREVLLPLLQERLPDWGVREVVLVGHSRGGVLAQMTAMELALQQRLQVRAVYTFGQPRAGDRVFREASVRRMGSRYFRVEHVDDLTPQVPPSAAGARFAADLVSERLPGARRALRSLVRELGFAHTAGRAFALDPQQGTLKKVRSSLKREKSVYEKLSHVIRLSNYRNMFEELSRYGSLHQPESYLCDLAAEI